MFSSIFFTSNERNLKETFSKVCIFTMNMHLCYEYVFMLMFIMYVYICLYIRPPSEGDSPSVVYKGF